MPQQLQIFHFLLGQDLIFGLDHFSPSELQQFCQIELLQVQNMVKHTQAEHQMLQSHYNVLAHDPVIFS